MGLEIVFPRTCASIDFIHLICFESRNSLTPIFGISSSLLPPAEVAISEDSTKVSPSVEVTTLGASAEVVPLAT